MNIKRETETDTDGLDALFAAARDRTPAPLPRDLEARLLADAQAALPRPARRPRWLDWIGTALEGIGGTPGLAGMAAAGIAGVWIGFVGPGPAADLASGTWALASRSPDVITLSSAGEDESLLDLIAGATE